MKGFTLILAACLAPIVFQGAVADDSIDAARAATRRGASSSVVSNRQKSKTTTAPAANNSISRTTNLSAQGAQSVRERSDATTPRSTNNVVSRTTNRTSTAPTVTARTTASPQVRTTQTPPRSNNAIARIATTNRASQSRSANTSRAATTNRASQSRSANTSRTATGAVTRDDVLGKNYSRCRTVYNDCMDEFCANKDSQLRRCACSARANEFDRVKKQLSAVEDKMLDFNQRLLTVNMDKEDAAALFSATEGELAFQQKDTSASKKMLDEIAKKLKTSFDSSNFDTNLQSLSWSLDTDSAFDSVDSLMGTATTSKTGTALYSAALPVCREMAQEVCSPDELEIAQSGYQMMIEQDCNTVAKSYESQTDQAREKVREGGALLDMSRLDIYQKRNSDDILTCKKKMLAMLSDTSVCGTDLGKCLDTTGRYIDPSTGEAFLTTNLAELTTLLTRPAAGQTWTSAPGNDTFVTFLNSKKQFLAPAMENCQDIADSVWDDFVEDALAQIKLAQDSKLEVMRQSCTTLTAQCLADTAESLSDFDARALSIFGVAADKTANAICDDIRTACTALLDATGGSDEWIGGMTEIATDKTYDTIIQTCREVGRSCIIQACKSIGGNFGLCENIQTSVNRKSIIGRTACWSDVKKCVASAGADSVNRIMQQLAARGDIDAATNSFYAKMYGTDPAPEVTNEVTNSDNMPCATRGLYTIDLRQNTKVEVKMNCIYDICEQECECKYNTDNTYSCASKDTQACKVCRLAERIWGNCEVNHTTLLDTNNHNRIRINENDPTATLLSWFAINTGTSNMDDSCRDTSCGVGYILKESNNKYECIDVANITKGDGEICQTGTARINIGTANENCCTNGTLDTFGHCCRNTVIDVSKLSDPDHNLSYIGVTNPNFGTTLCVADENATLVATFDTDSTPDKYYTPGNQYYLVCIGTVTADDVKNGFPSGQTLRCNGRYILVDENTRHYVSPNYESCNNGGQGCTTGAPYPSQYLYTGGNQNTPKSCGGTSNACTNLKWNIKYTDTQETE